jgi:hypothetical protein
MRKIDRLAQATKIFEGGDWRKSRPGSGFEGNLLPEGVWHDEDVAELDGGVETEAAVSLYGLM